MAPATTWNDLMKKADEGTKEFELLKDGEYYNFVIKEPAKVGQTGNGHPKFTINPSVESGERTNARVFHTFSVVDNAYVLKTFFFGDLATLGLGPEFFATNPSPEQIANALQGKRFIAQVVHEKGTDGKTRAGLKNISAPVGSAPSAGVGVPSGLPVATGIPAAAPVAPSIPQVAQAAPVAPQQVIASPWETAPAPAAPVVQAPVVPAPQPTNTIPLPPPLGS